MKGKFKVSLIVIALIYIHLSSCVSDKAIIISPGQSIQRIIDQAENGDVIILTDGIYYETITIDKSIILKAEHSGEVIITNKFNGEQKWTKSSDSSQVWYTSEIDWPVHRLLVNGIHAFDYRTKDNFDNQECGPYWSKGWQEEKIFYGVPPVYFAWDSMDHKLWLKLDDLNDPNTMLIEFNSSNLGGKTLVQKDLGTGWNQQEIVEISNNPSEHPVIHWYEGIKDNPSSPRVIDFPKICGIIIDINADNVRVEGIRIQMAPTVGIEVNNSKNVVIHNCYFSGYQYAINTGYECTNLRVTNCEMDGGLMVSEGKHSSVYYNMWYHSTYVNPIKFNGTGLVFQHNYVYEGYDLFHPRGRHKDYAFVPDLRSDVSFNVWQNNLDNVAEFDGVEALMNLRFHHNLIISEHDALAITTTENGGPLTIDHNLWWPGGGRIMKLVGTGRTNSGVEFIHNTYFAGATGSANRFKNSVFENNIVVSACSEVCWSDSTLGAFFPTRFNLLKEGKLYAPEFAGETGNPILGKSPETLFLLQPGSPAINASVENESYHQENVKDGKPDLGALEYGETIEDWYSTFGHCGPTWINAENQQEKAPQRPEWPAEIDKKWGGLK